MNFKKYKLSEKDLVKLSTKNINRLEMALKKSLTKIEEEITLRELKHIKSIDSSRWLEFSENYPKSILNKLGQKRPNIFS